MKNENLNNPSDSREKMVMALNAIITFCDDYNAEELLTAYETLTFIEAFFDQYAFRIMDDDYRRLVTVKSRVEVKLLQALKQKEATMSKQNIANGWRSPEEKPIDETELLIVMKTKRQGFVFVMHTALGIEHAKSSSSFELLAWQYCPVWSTLGSGSNIANGWRDACDRPLIYGQILVVLEDHKDHTEVIKLIDTKNFDEIFYDDDYTPIAWQYCPEWVTD